MGNELYELEEGSNAMTFKFTSVGPNGAIPKLVIYTEIDNNNVYNLGFGDKNPNTGKIDDSVVTDNKDSQKVLATVASTVYAFFDKHPTALIVATGSTKARTRLYQMGISNNLEDITVDFNVFGRKGKIWCPFEKNIEYNAFIITLKENLIWKI